MATVYYPAIIERDADGFGVFFPDLPGCVSAGDTAQEAALGAEEALSGHLSVMIEHGDALPDPSDLDTIERDADVDEVARILVRGERPGRAVRVQLSIDEALLARIDRVASNRSAWIAEAARSALRRDDAKAASEFASIDALAQKVFASAGGFVPSEPASGALLESMRSFLPQKEGALSQLYFSIAAAHLFNANYPEAEKALSRLRAPADLDG